MATSYANKGGSGNRRATITCSSGLFYNNISPYYLFDGYISNQIAFNNGLDVTDHFIKIDFNSGVDKRVYAMSLYQGNTTNLGTWKVQASNNDSDWVDLTSNFTFGTSNPHTIDLSSNTNEYRYYRLLGVSGTTNTGGQWARELLLSYTDTHGQGDIIYMKGDMSITYQYRQGLLDGSYGNHCFFDTVADISGKYITFDFGEESSKIIDEVKFYRGSATNEGTWKFQGSNDESSWTDIGSQFTVDEATKTISLAGNTTGYRYYRMIGISGSTTNYAIWLREIEFKIDDAVTTSIKKFNSITYADMKAVQGVAKANIKKVQGVE
jgi:hypothetical protein